LSSTTGSPIEIGSVGDRADSLKPPSSAFGKQDGGSGSASTNASSAKGVSQRNIIGIDQNFKSASDPKRLVECWDWLLSRANTEKMQAARV